MKTPPGGFRKWPISHWEELLSLVLPVLSDLGTNWTLGGGTALFLSLSHRVSYDIDIFLEDSRELKHILRAEDLQKTLDRVRLLRKNFAFEEAVGQFIHMTEPRRNVSHILDKVINALDRAGS